MSLFEEEDRAWSPGSSCLSLKSDQSKDPPLFFSTEPGPSDTKLRSGSPGSTRLSVKSDWSKDSPPYFSDEQELLDTKERKSGVSAEEQLSRCALCQDVLKDPVSTSCGHWFCRRCITSYWDHSGSSLDSPCPQCGQRSRTSTGLQRVSQTSTVQTDSGLQEVLDEHKISLRDRCERVTEGTDGKGSGTLLNKIYTELYITEGQSEEVNTQHEVWQLETASKMETLDETPIKCHNIFKSLSDQQRRVRVVLTNGVAGVGKSFSVQKFTLDWAEGLENQDVSLLVLLSFRELNLIRDEQHSLLTLLHIFHPTLQKVTAEKLAVCKVLFIFDGLDETRLSLDFNNREVVSDVTHKSSVNVLLTNLIQGNLLPSALVWITSRPAAANQIPPTCVDRVTEVRGFTDAQKEEYFRRRFSDEELSSRIISHIKTSRSLHIMCQIPVFCWISATVLEHMLTTEQRGELPRTLTDLYSHFLLVQTKRKKLKYNERHKKRGQELTKADREVLLKLGRLAFENLEKGNIMFYQEDLEQCGLDVTEALVYSGMCTEIFKRESVIFQKTVYCFVHLSIQEFLAAVYMFHCYTYRNTEVLEDFLKDVDDDSFFEYDDGDTDQYLSMDDFLRRAMDISLESENGHLDLFVRFLHGLSLESNQRLLRGLLGWAKSRAKSRSISIQRTINNLKKMDTYDISPDRSINIFHCLMEMNDNSVHQEIQEFLKSENRSEKKLSVIHCSALAYMLQMSEEVLDEFDLKKYRTSIKGKQRLLPAVRNCRKAQLSGCELTALHCRTVASALKSNPSHLRQLDLGGNYLENQGVKLLSAGLESPHCRLETLRLYSCEMTWVSCAFLASALESNPSHLKELDLSENKLEDSGVKLLCGFLESPDCRLDTLRLSRCRLSEISCDYLVSALKSNPSHLKELDLSKNKLEDSGVKLLCGFLGSPDCRLETLRLSKCSVTHERCVCLATPLRSNPSHLRDLDLSGNKLKDLGVRKLCIGLKSTNCRLETLGLQSCKLSDNSCASLASALESNPSHLRELDLRGNDDLQDSGVKLLCGFLERPDCSLEALRFTNAEGSLVKLTENRKTKVCVEEELDRAESSGSRRLSMKMKDDPGHSALELDDRENRATSDRHREYDSYHPPEPATSSTNLDVSEDSREEAVLTEDELCTDVPDILMQQQQHLDYIDALTGPWKDFSPDLLTESGNISYSFRCPGPGAFQCTSTGLVFLMAKGAELLYRTVQWDESLLQSAGKTAAGPLFDIQCSEDALCQLHLPHCETKHALSFEGLLSVVHVSNDGMSILEPLEVTGTHVVVRVPHLSAFGLVWALEFLGRIWNNMKPISGQVLLFLRPPNPKTKRQNLNVLLLPSNIPLEKVSAKQRDSVHIQTPSICKLIKDQSYTIDCPMAHKIQPQNAEFNLEFGPNYHPTFEVRLPTDTGEVAVTVRDQTRNKIWEYDVDLTDATSEKPPCPQSLSPVRTLSAVRTVFVDRVSAPVLNQLLDRLLQEGFINDEEMESVSAQTKANGARALIDMVRRKGKLASSFLMDQIRKMDRHLSKTLFLS
ncbi:NACHT, LRR and PYD domains-containing protein 12-like isoform X14 [Xiphias gladius]|uniref:NACHT, LRR and PYD domains-containing protein 12-like isoform X14 n=1 Tax=Xiphias gladius TaxID=8245 RepID=UPI001A991A5B|nr:NACHT, LRR and PYD domains-containing protein 12-like isoform X14 [Xiphias gladius]